MSADNIILEEVHAAIKCKTALISVRLLVTLFIYLLSGCFAYYVVTKDTKVPLRSLLQRLLQYPRHCLDCK